MKLSTSDLQELAAVAVAAATEAGQMIARSRPMEVHHKADAVSLASQVVTDVDHRSEAIILDHLGATLDRFELGLLTEERDDDGGRLVADHFWCVDPLDGTLSFVDGSPGYAVSIALVARNGKPLIGVVCDPTDSTVTHAISGLGAFRDGRPWSIDVDQRCEVLSVFADRSFHASSDPDAAVAALDRIARDVGFDGVRLRSPRGAVMNACGVLTDTPACYLKFPGASGGGSLWDFAATACLFDEVGAVATDMFGDPLDLNRADSTFMNHRGVLFASDGDLARRMQGLEPTES